MSDQSKTYSQTSLWDIPKFTSLPALEYGQQPSVEQGGPTIDLSGPVRARVNLSPRQAKEKGLLMSGTYGHPSSTLSRTGSNQRYLSLVNRLRARTDSLGSTLYKLTWKQRGTPSGRSIFALRASVPRTSAKDFSSMQKGWPTPDAMIAQDGEAFETWNTRRLLLKEKHKNGNGVGTPLTMAAQLVGWPTPDTANISDGTPFEKQMENMVARRARVKEQKQNGSGRSMTLQFAAQATGWPTPNTMDTVNREGLRPSRISTGRKSGYLTEDILHIKNNPQAARLTASGEILTGSMARTISGGRLDPAHSRWLMSLPPEWCSCGVTATLSLKKSPKSSSKQ